MGAFEYKALDVSGRQKRGTLQGDTERQIRQLLREQKLTPLQVKPVNSSVNKTSSLSINTKELALITRQLASLIDAAIPLEDALHTTAEQADKRHIKRLLVALRSRVMEGHSLSKSMQEFPKAFPTIYYASIAAGEQAGHLASILLKLADHAETREELGRRTLIALIYPAFITFAALAVVTGLLVYVVPQVVDVFTSLNQQLPWLTTALIALSSWLDAYGIYFLITVSISLFVFTLSMRQPPFRMLIHRLLLFIPILKNLIRAINSSRFSATLSILTTSGVPVVQALTIASQVITNLPIRHAVEQATAQIREGSSIHKALASSAYFPPMIIQLIASGERSGQLDSMLARAASITEKEVTTTLDAFMAIIEPALILLVGILVLLIVLAILLPIFDINQLIQ